MSLELPVQPRSDTLRGIAFMLASTAIFVVNDTLMKIAATHMPTGQAIFVRGLLTSLLGAILIAASGAHRALPHALSGPVLWRAAADVGGTIFFLNALVRMPMADVFGILQFVPLAVTAGAALFLRANIGWRRWAASCVGLLGVLIIVRPGGSAFTPAALLAILAVLFSALRDLLSRSVPAEVPPLIIVTVAAAVVAVASLGFTVVETWRWPQGSIFLIVLGASAALLAGQAGLVVAMRTGHIGAVAPFRYSMTLWAVLAGYAVWGEIPDVAAWAGICIVTTAGLYTFWREQRLALPRSS
jgi:drug/metabolite transporter (DMT)-like permease